MALCACGCGVEVKGKWVRGHHARVNNPSKRDDVKQKRREMFIRLHEEGKLGDPWNRGLTKETDERVAKYGVEGSKTWTEEKRERYSRQMTENRLSGVVPTLTGSAHSQWQGGTSSITQRIRGNKVLYEQWKRPILIEYGFRCFSCGAGAGDERLAVHHDQERFADILKRFLPEDGHELSWEEETEVVERVVDYHVQNRVSGVVLCYPCHEKVHSEEKSEDCD